MAVRCLHDRGEIERFLRGDVYLHLYALGDLDDDKWPYTTWYAWPERGPVEAIGLVYSRFDEPVLQALENTRPAAAGSLLEVMQPFLPPSFGAHLSPGLAKVLAAGCEVHGHDHLKLALLEPARLDGFDTTGAVRLGPGDAADVVQLHLESHPASSFHPSMLAMPHFGRRVEGKLVCVAGMHVCSEQQGVAALANIATHPAHRRQGHARAVVGRLCQELLGRMSHIGLNVRADNEAALACYRKLGFEPVARYGEYAVERR